MLFASIDIGSNAAKLLFANVSLRNGVPHAEKVSRTRIPLRLGDDVFNKGTISEQKQEELIKTLTAFKLLIDVYQPINWIACGSAALRDATNSEQVIERIERGTGITLKVISGLEEAQYITSAYHTASEQKYKMFVDLGGGSTEISVLRDNLIKASKSFQIGVIRYLNHTIEEAEWESLKHWIKDLKKALDNLFIIATGGTINNLAKLYGTKESQMIYLKELKHARIHLSGYTIQERIEKLGIQPDRADVLIPACEIFINIMKQTASEKICVPGIGLGDGLIYNLYKDYIASH
jgi:exopolyphosphatase / guanosine-5'-triphosphate,3'-diphosphate pyrophosphatase